MICTSRSSHAKLLVTNKVLTDSTCCRHRNLPNEGSHQQDEFEKKHVPVQDIKYDKKYLETPS